MKVVILISDSSQGPTVQARLPRDWLGLGLGPTEPVILCSAFASLGRRMHLYVFSDSGTFPPFSASLIITCLCSQMFIAAESLVLPV